MMNNTLQGGTRLNSQSPLKIPGLPVVTVITVVYNCVNLIEKTIGSILAQTYSNIEYILVDGGSNDGTVDIIRKYDNLISYWKSEPDRGIYDAMNKGLALATGDFVWFINAGDLIYSDDVLEKIFTARQPRGGTAVEYLPSYPIIIYGDTMIVDADYREVGLRRLRPPEILTWKSFKKGMLVCHQAILVSRAIAEPFDPQYRHSADFDWVVRMLKKAGDPKQNKLARAKEPTIINTHQVLCAFLDGGHSKHNIGISLRERFHSMTRHYGLITTMMHHIPIVIRFGWYYLINKRF
jgi:glycosyltransferase involved in cell wall biosynthesis